MTTLLPAEPPPDEDEDVEEALEYLYAYEPKSDWVKELIKRRIAMLEERLK